MEAGFADGLGRTFRLRNWRINKITMCRASTPISLLSAVQLAKSANCSSQLKLGSLHTSKNSWTDLYKSRRKVKSSWRLTSLDISKPQLFVIWLHESSASKELRERRNCNDCGNWAVVIEA